MKLSKYAKLKGVSYRTAYRWFRSGNLNAEQLPTGTIIINSEQNVKHKNNKVWIYARVSSYGKKSDLERQAQRCIDYASIKGFEVEKVVKEIASGMNDKRPKLLSLLSLSPTRILVEHKDRLTRFGFNYFEVLLAKLGCELIVINRDAEEREDLIKDLVAIITSFCCRIYGLRRGNIKAKKLKTELKND